MRIPSDFLFVVRLRRFISCEQLNPEHRRDPDLRVALLLLALGPDVFTGLGSGLEYERDHRSSTRKRLRPGGQKLRKGAIQSGIPIRRSLDLSTSSSWRRKQSARADMLEAKSNLLRLKQEIPLSGPELAAVDEGLAAYEKLLTGLWTYRLQTV